MKRKSFPGSGAIAPETMRVVWAAFDAAWSTVEKSGAIFPDPDKARDILGKGIIDPVRSGEHEPMKLTALGILALANSDLGKTRAYKAAVTAQRRIARGESRAGVPFGTRRTRQSLPAGGGEFHENGRTGAY
jgi:hypothetical protein